MSFCVCACERRENKKEQTCRRDEAALMDTTHFLKCDKAVERFTSVMMAGEGARTMSHFRKRGLKKEEMKSENKDERRKSDVRRAGIS